MLYQSLKSIHYRTLLIFQNKKKPNRFEGQNMGGGIKDMLSPPCQNMGGDTSTTSPQDLRPWPYFEVNPPSTTEQLNTEYECKAIRTFYMYT